MPKVEKAIHLDAFKLYMEMGGINLDFLGKFGKKFGKSKSTAYGWEKAFDWKARAKEPISEAVRELEAEQKLDATELIGGLLDLCQNRMDGLATQAGYIKAIFATAFDRITTGQLKVESISDLKELVLAQSRLARDEQAYMRLVLTLIGEPEKIMEDRMILQFVGLPEGILDDSSDTNAADIQEAD